MNSHEFQITSVLKLKNSLNDEIIYRESQNSKTCRHQTEAILQSAGK